MNDYTAIVGPKNDVDFVKMPTNKAVIPPNDLVNIQNTRNFRELFLYELINSIDEATPDGAKGQSSYERIPMTLGQKKRLRNQIFRDATLIVNKHNEKVGEKGKKWSADDPSHLVEAFFRSELGSKYASLRSEWNADGAKRKETINRIFGWSGFDNAKHSGTIAISPYDPMFNDNDIFSEHGQAYDGVLYCKGIYHKGNVSDIPEKFRGQMGETYNDKRVMEVVTNPKTKNLMVTLRGGYKSSERHIMEATNENISTLNESSRELLAMDSELSASGYMVISRYIKTRKAREDVQAYFKSVYEEHGPADTKQIEFMKQLCDYLTENGRAFSVEMCNDGHPIAKLDNGIQIRLFDPDSHNYQGRIYDSGMVAYLGSSTGKLPYNWLEKVEPEDKMNLVRWYFGESPVMRHEKLANGKDVPINKKIRVGRFSNNIDYTNNKTKRANAVYYELSSGGKKSAVTLGTVQAKHEEKDYARTAFLTAYYGTNTPGNNTIEQAFSAGEIKKQGFLRMYQSRQDEFEKYLPAEKRYPDYPNDLLADPVDDARIEYYMHLQAREKLNTWVESAKTNFKQLVNIEDVIDKAFEYSGDDNYEYPFSADPRIAEVQKLYYDAALLNVPDITGNLTVRGAKGSEERTNLEKALKEHILNQYEGFVENEFGSIPEIVRDDLNVVQNDAIGLNVENVARYTTVQDAAGIQANYKAIRHMILKLGNDYNANFINTSTYMGAEIHNGNVMFDENRKIADATVRGVYHANALGTRIKIEDQTNADIKKKLELPGLDDKPVTKEMMFHTLESLLNSGCYPNSINISVDEQGIISYSAYIPQGSSSDFEYDVKTDELVGESKGKRVAGQIGRVFEPDQYGAIHLGAIGGMSTFDEEDGSMVDDGNYGNSKVIIPGYDAYLAPVDPDHPQPIGERLRLFDWKARMKQEITRCVKESVFSNKDNYDFIPHTSDLNVVYKHSYATAIKEDEFQSWLPKDPANPTPEEVTRLNVIKTLSGRCRFPNEYGDGATTMAQSMLEHPSRYEAKMYDYYYSDLCDNENLRVLGEFFDGIFDKDMTGTAKTQGIVRYLADGVTVDSSTGKVTPSKDKNAACALMKDELFKFKDFDTWDRRLMSSTQVLTSLHTPRHVGVAMMDVDGWTFDDGFLISKKFAEKYAIDDAHNPGQKRPLIAQDKLSDLHGNKGVISKVIDPDFCSIAIKNHMSIVGGVNLAAPDVTEAKIIYQGKTYDVSFDKSDPTLKIDYTKDAISQIQKANGFEGMDDVLTLFYENPNLDVVAAPYSGMSRFNGGSVRQLQQESEALIVNGKKIDGGMGYTDLIVVDMPVDVKTHFYKDSDIREGKGRKASGQLAWALQSKGCDAIMSEFYGNNHSAMDNLREYAIAIGMDFDEEMRPRVGYRPQAIRSERRTIMTPTYDGEIEYTSASTSGNRSLKANVRKAIHEQCLAALNENGGVMELPFPLKFNTLDYVKANTNKLDENMMVTQNITKNTYGLPMLPAVLRSGMEFQDGSPKAHDYTVHYTSIYANALIYTDAKNHVDELSAKKVLSEEQEKEKAFYQSKMEDAKTSAQASLDKITTDIIDRKFSNKNNVVRADVMSSRLNHSATAVWSADPRLNLDEVSMSFEHAKLLGLYTLKKDVQPYLLDEDGQPVMKDGQYVENPNLTEDDYEPTSDPASVLVWRDPILHDSNVRYLKVKIDNNITGVCINPLIDKPFDGDFDGDSVAIVALQTQEAKSQAFSAFSMNNNLLNYGVKNEDGTYPLYIQDGLDVASNLYGNDKLKEQYKDIEVRANMIEDIARRAEEDMAGNFPTGKVSWEFNDGRGVMELPVKVAIRRAREELLDELNGWSHKALTGIGTDHVVVKDSKTIIASCQHIVDTGAKGSQSKMADFADNMGISYELGEDGKADLSTVKDITTNGKPVPKAVKEGISRDVDKKIQETAAYKADNTSLGGTTSINGVTACRDKDIHAVLELTYPITQAILQSKHDPKDAKVKDEIVRFWGKDCWDGFKLTGDWTLTDPGDIQAQSHEKIRIPVFNVDSEKSRAIMAEKYKKGGIDGLNPDEKSHIATDKEGNYQYTYEKCTPAEWKAQMKGMMTALKVDVNPDYIDKLAEIMERTQDGPVRGINGFAVYDYGTRKQVMGCKGTIAGFTDYATEQGTLLDRMAYSEKLSALFNEALLGNKAKSLFSNAVTNDVTLMRNKIERRMTDDKTRKKECLDAINACRRAKANSSMFAPTVFVREKMYDEDRMSVNPPRVLNQVIKGKGKNMKIAEEWPKPIGRRDSFLSQEDYDNGVRYFGEKQDAYENRLIRRDLLKKQAEESTEVKTVESAIPEVEVAEMPIVEETTKVTKSSTADNPFKKTSKTSNKTVTLDIPTVTEGHEGSDGSGLGE